MSELLDGKTRDFLRTLEVGSREVMLGVRYGMHRSKRRGISTDFTHHRSYMAGDPIKSLDWKVYARTGRHYVKQFLDSSALTVWTVLDNSNSMHDHPEQTTLSQQAEGMVPKIDLALRLAAALSALTVRQQDSAGLLVSGAPPRFLPARSSNSHLGTLMHTLAEARSQGDDSDPSVALRQLSETVGKGHLVILISDLFFEPEQTRDTLRELRGRGADIILYQLESPMERDFEFSHWVDFQCLEKGTRHRVDTTLLQEAYRKEHQTLQEEWDSFCKRQGIEVYRFDTQQPLETILNNSLRQRAARG